MYLFRNYTVCHDNKPIQFKADDEIVFLDDPPLQLFAWGGGKSARRTWLEGNHPGVNITGRVTRDHFTQLVVNGGRQVQAGAIAADHVTQTTINDWIHQNNKNNRA